MFIMFKDAIDVAFDTKTFCCYNCVRQQMSFETMILVLPHRTMFILPIQGQNFAGFLSRRLTAIIHDSPRPKLKWEKIVDLAKMMVTRQSEFSSILLYNLMSHLTNIALFIPL